jgi:hypothetical protein
MNWVTIGGMEEHWQRARVQASLRDRAIVFTAEKVTDLEFDIPAGRAKFSPHVALDIGHARRSAAYEPVGDAKVVGSVQPLSDRSLKVQLHLADGQWKLGPRPDAGLRKRHNLQGPIDDAFMDSFIFVRPTGKAWHAGIGQWSHGELEHAIEHWRRHFRGHARLKDDSQIDEQDIANSNLVLWGDPGSNQVLARIADQLPIVWDEKQITVGDRHFPAESHAVIAIYPNPLNHQRYVVLNSSFTFREYAYLNNARQVPKLPDWAIVDVRTAPDSLWPGKIADADFFDEAWRLKPPHAITP